MPAVAELVAILEDDANRITAMQFCLANLLPSIEVVFFEDAQLMIDWLGDNLGEVVLISLDHDLPPRDHEGKTIDCGNGRQVADYLGSVPPTCPVIVHSSNSFFTPGMFFALKDAGWPCNRIYPCDDTAWIASAWAEQVRKYSCDGWIGRSD
jgi:hypothetical protein